MLKKFLIILFLIFLNNCTYPGSALMGPAFTGATTKSITQTTISFGSNQIVKKIKETSKRTKDEVVKIAKKVDDFSSEIKSKDFYTSVKSLYLKEKKKKDVLLFHR